MIKILVSDMHSAPGPVFQFEYDRRFQPPAANAIGPRHGNSAVNGSWTAS